MSGNERWMTAPDGLRVPLKRGIYPEAEGYLSHINQHLDHAEKIVRDYAQLLKTKTEAVIAGTITIEQFAEQAPANTNVHVRNLNHMRQSIIDTWHLRPLRLERMAREAAEEE